MIQFFKDTQGLQGATAEAGCLFGLSSYLMCSYDRLIRPGYLGEQHHIVDSFKGFRSVSGEDVSKESHEIVYKIQARKSDPNEKKGFMKRTQNTLAEFPGITYHKGWIPDVFEDMERLAYRFVHIDLDLYEPILHTLRFFYPQVVTGGVLVVDDYGCKAWPRAKKAVDDWCAANKIKSILLYTGNAVIIKQE
jgi:hypothetical protein